MDDRLSTDDLDRSLITWADVERLDRVPLRVKRGRSKSWAKVRAYRQRQRTGHIVLKVEVEEHAIAEYLMASGRLSAAETFSRRHVERAVAEVLAELAAMWPPKKV